MIMAYYPAVITYVPDDEEYIVEFVDFPEGLTGAKRLCEALDFAQDCLWCCINYRLDEGIDVPAPSEFVPNLTQLPDRVSWWTMVPYADMADDENFERIMSGLEEVADMVKDRPVSVIGLEMSPKGTDAETALSQESLDALINKHRDELLANPPTNKFWLDETALGLIPGKW